MLCGGTIIGMHKTQEQPQACQLRQTLLPPSHMIIGGVIRPAVAELIRKEHPEFDPSKFVCATCNAKYRAEFVEDVIEKDKGELSDIDKQVIDSLRENELIVANLNEELGGGQTFGQRIADHVARFGGSWTFIMLFAGVIAGWIVLNCLSWFFRPFDPYPFIFLNLILSMVAALQAPVIMMSQNRQSARDRLQADHDYRVNLKAEVEIRLLHTKLDQMLSHQWQRLLELQQLQIEMMEELRK